MNKLTKAVFKAYKAICQKRTRRILLAIPTLYLGLAVSSPYYSWARGQEVNARERKLIARIEPHYPPTLERLYIGGVVRLKVVVAPNGVVQSTELIGGNPILGQSAIAAVKQWRYTPGKTETTIVERLEFDPHR